MYLYIYISAAEQNFDSWNIRVTLIYKGGKKCPN